MSKSTSKSRVCTGVDCLDSAPATSPWHLRDYNPSPQVHYPPQQPAAAQSVGASLRTAPRRSSLGQPALASSLQPSPSAARHPATDSDDDDDDDDGCAMLITAPKDSISVMLVLASTSLSRGNLGALAQNFFADELESCKASATATRCVRVR